MALAQLASRQQALRITAWTGWLLAIVVVAASAHVRHLRDGLGCAPWPECYVAVEGSVAHASDIARAQFVHRVAATGVLLGCVVAAMLAGRRSARERAIASAALGVALLLAVLGAALAGSRAPAYVLSNLVGGFALAALWTLLVARSSITVGPSLRSASRCALALLFVQVALGTLAATHGVVATCAHGGGCGSWTWGELIASGAPDLLRAAGPLEPHAAAGLLALHRATGAAVAVGAVVLAGGLWAKAHGCAIVLGASALLTAVLGVASLLGAAPLPTLTLHNLAAATIAAALVRLAMAPACATSAD